VKVAQEAEIYAFWHIPFFFLKKMLCASKKPLFLPMLLIETTNFY
jgi:hypothetical protein